MDTAFLKLRDGLDVRRALFEVRHQKELWSQITARQTTPGSPHVATETIFLRWAREQSLDACFNELEAVDYPALDQLPETRKLLDWFAAFMNPSKIGRVILVSLKPDSHITPHVDEGHYADNYDRFHIPLYSETGNYIFAETEANFGQFVHMRPGEVWWFNNKCEHWVSNHSDRPRLHLIIDAVVPNVGRMGKTGAAA
jgi:hypothetical protein